MSGSITDLYSPSSASPTDSKGARSIRPPFRWFSRVVIPLGIVLASAGLLLATAWHALQPALSVEVERAVLRSIEGATRPAVSVVQAAGWLEPDPFPYLVTALTPGIIEDIYVLDGQSVTSGQVVARLVADDAIIAYDRAKAALDTAAADLAEAHVRLTAAQEEWDNPIERDRAVAVAEANLSGIRATIRQRESQIREQEALLAQALRTRDRLEELHRAKSVPLSEAEDAATDVDVAHATLDALRDQLIADREKEAAYTAELHAAERHRTLRIKEKQERDAAVIARDRAHAVHNHAQAVWHESDLRVERLSIRAPVDGIVSRVHKVPGDKAFHASDNRYSATIVTVYDPQKLQVRVDVPLVDAARIYVGQPCEIISEVLPNQRFSGRVTRIRHEADVQKNTLEVHVEVHDPAPELRPDMLSRVRFLAPVDDSKDDDGTTAVFIPINALQDERVWIVEQFDGQRGIAVPRSVGIGERIADWVAVTSVQPGDMVIRTPSPNLRSGRRVTVRHTHRE